MPKERTIRNAGGPHDGSGFLNGSAAVLEPPVEVKPFPSVQGSSAPPRKRRSSTLAAVRHYAHPQVEDHAANRQAELFYLQKQIQQQTQMIFVLEDGTRIQGVVEWYDRNCIKVRGKSRTLIYKTAVKYLYKAGEIGTAPSE